MKTIDDLKRYLEEHIPYVQTITFEPDPVIPFFRIKTTLMGDGGRFHIGLMLAVEFSEVIPDQKFERISERMVAQATAAINKNLPSLKVISPAPPFPARSAAGPPSTG